MQALHAALSLLAAASLVIGTAAGQEAFEVASVKAALPGGTPFVDFQAYPGGRVVVTNYTLRMIIAETYLTSEYRVTAGPLWIEREFYNIEAKPPAGSAAAAFVPPSAKAHSFPLSDLQGSADILRMMQTLIAERFSLTLHRETHQLPVLALTVGKRSLKLEPSKDASAERVCLAGEGKNQCRNVTMATIIATLEARNHRLILDRTGLKGGYDFNLSYDPNSRDDIDGFTPADDAKGISLKLALQTQVGLVIKVTKGPVELIVIDRAEKPTGN